MAAPSTSRIRMCRRLDRGGPVPREDLSVGDVVAGPAVIAEANATTVVDAGWRARVTDHSHLMLRRTEARPGIPGHHRRGSRHARAVQQPLHVRRGAVGERLRATANSVNIKEARLLLCALRHRRPSDCQRPAHAGHLGSMGESIPGRDRRTPGRCDPATPMSSTTRTAGYPPARHHRGHPGVRRPRDILFVASRGHHAEVGGITPGSMPPSATGSRRKAS